MNVLKSSKTGEGGGEGQERRASFIRRIFCAGLPVLLSNPDGSLSEGRPYGYRDPTPPRTPREGFMTAADISARLFGDVLGGGDPAVVSEELTLLYERHRTAFAILLVVQAVIEGLFLAYHIHHSALAIHDILTMYRTSSHKLVAVVFWSVMVAEIVYMTIYLAIGFWSIYTHRAKHYGYFSTCCLTGIVGHVLLAYANQFNLIIFFLRLTSYIYGKFLRDVVVGMMLLPPPSLLASHIDPQQQQQQGYYTPESLTPSSHGSLSV